MMLEKILRFFGAGVYSGTNREDLFSSETVQSLLEFREEYVRKNPNRVYVGSIIELAEMLGIRVFEFDYVMHKELANVSSYLKIENGKPLIAVEEKLHVTQQRIEIAYHLVRCFLQTEPLENGAVSILMNSTTEPDEKGYMAIACELLAPHWLVLRKKREYNSTSFLPLERYFCIPESYIQYQIKNGYSA